MERRRIRRRRTRGWGLSFSVWRRYSKTPNLSSETNEKTKPIRYLTCEDVINICKDAIRQFGGHFGMISKHNLNFTVEYMRDYEGDLFDKAALLLHGIAFSHPFLNGNKRTAFIATLTFLRMNGWGLDIEQEEVIRFMLEVASGRKTIREIKAWLLKHAKRIKPTETSKEQGGDLVTEERRDPCSKNNEISKIVKEIMRKYERALRELAKY